MILTVTDLCFLRLFEGLGTWFNGFEADVFVNDLVYLLQYTSRPSNHLFSPTLHSICNCFDICLINLVSFRANNPCMIVDLTLKQLIFYLD